MLGIYSHSALKTFRDCPRKFKFQYIEKPEIPRFISAEAYLGNAVHRVLQILYQRGDDGVVLPLETALDLYDREWEKIDRSRIAVVSEFMGADDYIRLGREMLTKHYEEFRPFRYGTLLGTELFLSFTLPGTPFKLRGVVDRLWKRDDGVIEICDYKTGRHLPRPHDADFFYQMGMYRLAVAENYPQHEQVEVAQYFLRLGEIVRYRFTPDDLDKLTEDLRLAIITTLQSEKLDDFPPQESNLCNWCEYFKLCPAKRHRVALEEETEDEATMARRAAELATDYIEKNEQARTLKAELDALKDDLARLAGELDMTKFETEDGSVSVQSKREEKFITKTDDPEAFTELAALVRDLGMEEYFKLDAPALMRDGYARKRLDPEILEKLKAYVREKESVRITVRRKRSPDNDAD